MATQALTPNQTIRAALYARVSTADKGQNPEVQLRELREYATRQGWSVVAEYVDAGVSGMKESRPQLDRMMEDAKAGKFDALLVWKWDRFARSAIHLLKTLEVLASQNVSFVSTTQGMDTRTPVGKMIFTVLAAVAEMERALLVERVNSGLANARANGVQLGRRANETDDEAIQTMHKEGKSARFISRELDIPLTTVRRRLAGKESQ